MLGSGIKPTLTSWYNWSMPAGRPKKTLKDLPKNWEELLIDLGNQGGAKIQMQVALKIDDDTLERLEREDKKFSVVLKEAQKASEAWWLAHGSKQLENRNFNAVLWYMNMKNRWGWKDRQDVTSGDKEIQGTSVALPVKDDSK